MDKYYELINFWLEALIGSNDKHSIEKEENSKQITLVIKVEKAEMGKVIGKNGRIITSLRNLINAIAKKEKKSVKILVKDI